MSTTSVKLLHAAAEVVGGEKALAERLGIGEQFLSMYIADLRPLPDWLLLRAVDIILEDRHARGPAGRDPGVQSLGAAMDRSN
jgi:hypothetical protein